MTPQRKNDEIVEKLKDVAYDIDAMALKATIPDSADRWTVIEVRHAGLWDDPPAPDGWDVTIEAGGL
jgi:hypothetical protein